MLAVVGGTRIIGRRRGDHWQVSASPLWVYRLLARADGDDIARSGVGNVQLLERLDQLPRRATTAVRPATGSLPVATSVSCPRCTGSASAVVKQVDEHAASLLLTSPDVRCG